MQTISEEYRKLNADLHASPRKFGGGGYKHVSAVQALAEQHQLYSILDYGCGQGLLKAGLQANRPSMMICNYDPAIPEWDTLPINTMDMVVCTDVLEHIEPEFLDAVLEEICGRTRKIAYLVIACIEAGKVLPDGRNAHLIQQQPPWWINVLNRYPWKIIHQHTTPDKHRIHLTKRLTVTLEKI